MNYEEILLNYAKYFQQSDVVESAIRTVGWKLILLLRGICDACQSVWEAVFRVLSFTQVISEKLGTYYPIWNAIFLVTILAVGTVFLYSERRPPFLKNLIITMAVVMLLPGGVQLGVQLLGIEQNVFMANGTSVADTTVISNTTDLLYLKQNGWTFESPNCFTGETIKYIDQNEQVEKKTDKVFKYYMIVDESSGKVKYKEIKKGFFGFLTPLYYRYSINFMAIIGELIVNILVLIFASYRLFRLIWDMIYGEILAYIFSGDVMSGEKTKQTLQYLLNLFWSVSIMIWGFAIWREFELWVAKEYSNNFVRILLIAFAGIAMIDGPDIVERVLGIDVGMKDGLMKTIGAMHLLQAGLGATGVGKAAAKAASKVKEESLNPGGKEEQERLSKGAKEPPGGAGNAGNSSSSGATQNRRQEPPGSAERQSSGSKHAGQESAESTKAAEAASQEHTASSGQEPNAASGTSAGDTQSAGNPASEGTEHGVSSTEIPGGASTAEKVAGGEMPYGTAQEGKSDNQSKKQATPQQAGAGQEPPGKAGSQPEKTATGQANNKQQQKSGYGSSSEPRKTTEKSGQAKAAESTKQEPPGKAAAAGKSGEKSAAGTAGEQTQAQPSQDALPSNTDEGQEAMESQEPPTNWGGAGEIDNNSVPFSSGENEMPERGMSGNEPTAQDFPASSDQSEPDSVSERVRNGHTGTPIGEKTKSTQAVRNVSGQDSQSKSSAGTKQTTTQRTTTQKSEHVQNGHSNTKSATSPVRPEPPGNARKM
ncbi:MAG: pLS20_p028 family conjugation system transmembrane protein [Lachnospiraceae bacterium]